MHETQTGLTGSIAQFACNYRQAPDEAITIAKRGVIDAIGVMLCARQEPVVNHVRQMALAGNPQGRARVLLSALHTQPAAAAMINATAAHAFAMDDVAWGCHPSAILMPSIFAQAEAIGATGADALRAWIVGYEVLAELASREPDPLHETGWHPSGLLMPVAVAAAICNLMELDTSTATHALGIAASMTGGMAVNFGTQTKAFHAGRIASSGITAVELARCGMTAATDALERENGFLRTISPAGKADIAGGIADTGGGLRLLTTQVNIKKYPLCYSTHRIVDAAASVAAKPGFSVDEIAGIAITAGRLQANMAHYHRPVTAMQAKYSVEFAAVSGLVAQAAGFAQLDPGFINSGLVQRLISISTIELDDSRGAEPGFCRADRVVVTLRSGQELDSGDFQYALGHAQDPLGSGQLRRKFMDCAVAGGVPADTASSLYDQLEALETVPELNFMV